MRLPNGYGSIYKLTGKRRRPFVVKKSIGGRQIPLGYFETYALAIEFVLNMCVFSISQKPPTLS